MLFVSGPSISHRRFKIGGAKKSLDPEERTVVDPTVPRRVGMPEDVDADGIQHAFEKYSAAGEPFLYVPLHEHNLRLRVGIDQFFPEDHTRRVGHGSRVPQQLVERCFIDVRAAVIFRAKQFGPVVGIEDVGENAGVVVRVGVAEDTVGVLHTERARAGDSEGEDFHGDGAVGVVSVDIGVGIEHDGPAAQALEVGFGRHGESKGV